MWRMGVGVKERNFRANVFRVVLSFVLLLQISGIRLSSQRIVSVSAFPREPIVVLHGLLGSSRNVHSWNKELHSALNGDCDVIALDLRNHGQTFQTAGVQHDMSYEAMARDVVETLQESRISTCHLVGHSMGGKVAAVCRKIAPPTQSIQSVTLMDISPVAYDEAELDSVVQSINHLRTITSHWESLDKPALQTLVHDLFPDRSIAMFILSSIVTDPKTGSWSWTFALDAIHPNLANILSFPSYPPSPDTPALLVKGTNSKFVRSHHVLAVQQSFPNYAVASVRDAGHWVHVEQPRLTAQRVANFLIEAREFQLKQQQVLSIRPNGVRVETATLKDIAPSVV